MENKISSIDDLVKKTDFDSELKKTNDIANKNQSKYSHLENELKMFTLGYFKGKNYFEDSNLNYLIFEPNPAAFSTVELFVAKLLTYGNLLDVLKDFLKHPHQTKTYYPH